MHASRIIWLLGLTCLCAGQPGDSLPPEPPEANVESRNEGAQFNTEIKPLIEPASLPSNNLEIPPESSIDNDPANRNNEADLQSEEPNLPNLPVLNRETLEADLRLIEEYASMSPAERSYEFINGQMMTLIQNVEFYQKQNVIRRSFNVETFKQMFQNDKNKEQKAETSTDDNNLSDQLISELGLLAEDIDTWLKQNVDPRNKSNPTNFAKDIVRCEEGSSNRQRTSSESQESTEEISRPDTTYSRSFVAIVVGAIIFIWTIFQLAPRSSKK